MEPNFTVIKSKDYQDIVLTLKEILSGLEKLTDLKQKKYLSNKEVQKLLNLSSRTLQNKRDNGEIAFIKNGRKILYKFEDIEIYLNKRRIKGF